MPVEQEPAGAAQTTNRVGGREVTKTRYLCGSLLAIMLTAGVLMPVLPAWAQVSELPTAADLSIEKFDFPPETVAVGEPLFYELDVANNGLIPGTENLVPGTATDVVVRDELPPNTRFLSALPDSGCTNAGNVVTCELGDLGPGDERFVGFFACPTGPGDATNTATVGSDAVIDPRPDNNRAEETTEVTEPAVAGGGCTSQDPQPSPPSGGAADDGGAVNNNGGAANNGVPEITQETGQRAESGEIEQSFDVD